MLRKEYLVLLLGFGLNFSSSQAFAQVNQTTQKNIPFQICAEAKNWVRPSASKQKEYLTNLKTRYSNAQIQALGGTYWTYNFFAFVDYPGGSGVFDINNLSGLWSLKKGDSTENKKCTPISSIKGKNEADIWLFNYQPIKIKWVNRNYVMVVKPIQKGWKSVHFSRLENQEKLPLTVVTESGKKLQVLKYE
ncbi:MAG: hypothetical protein HC903_05075 [Methylacidiphilales bacterium]|nr:hypothetical protein [Candidatus Methylacidiphilales bacterium]NJR18267.1 hypothetical protein [Calothrix sp. CSU_2_0]